MFVTFIPRGRTGNNIFQYLMAKVIQLKYGHVYVPYCELEDSNIIYENDIDTLNPNTNLILDGYFQISNYYVPYRNELLKLNTSDDYWVVDNKQVYIRDFFKNTITLDDSIVISLRLDDFIQLPCKTSDIIPPDYYLTILEELPRKQVYIVVDTLRMDWEKQYIQYFKKWNPILIQGTLMEDFAVLRDCPILLHSNSTFCWIASFFSHHPKERYIPKTNFYVGQKLSKIEDSDILTEIKPLLHADVYSLHPNKYLHTQIFPLSYSIPDEYVVDEVPVKHQLLNTLVPGGKNEHRFGVGQEKEYNEQYQSCMFATTKKKGGWDCLRHYEILANGCIPLFEKIEECPLQTMTTFPKELVFNARNLILCPNKMEYTNCVEQLLDHTRKYCTTSANTNYFLSKIKKPIRNVLLIVGDPGVNYTREFFWIGMARYIQSIGGVAVEYPKLEFVYEDFTDQRKYGLHGNGYMYTNKLKNTDTYTDKEIIEKIKSKFFDIIVYGKVGPDENKTGSLPHFPLWEYVYPKYTNQEIVCLYGGDECIDLTSYNRYSQHIYNMAQYALCFVREFSK